MSANAGSVLEVYQGWRARRWGASSEWCPCSVVQMTVIVEQYKANGVVCSTASGARLRAWPAPRCSRVSAKVTSMGHLQAYLVISAPVVVVRSVVTRARS